MRRGALETPSVRSVDRVLSILEAVAKSQDPVPLGHLTDLLGINPSSAFRLANTLKRRGFLANPNGRKSYVLGPSMWRLSRDYDWSKMLISICHEHLKALVDRMGETAHFAVREGRQVFFVDHCVSTMQNIVVPGHTGEFSPLHCTAHGKALLADYGVTELKALYGNTQLKTYTEQTIGTIPDLAKACARIRDEGYAIDDSEYLREVRCVAAPIRDKRGVVIASIGISAPESRFPEAQNRTFGKHVCEVAERISGLLQTETAD
jgi:IclR family transcriptional regulator, acetate operon repressor